MGAHSPRFTVNYETICCKTRANPVEQSKQSAGQNGHTPERNRHRTGARAGWKSRLSRNRCHNIVSAEKGKTDGGHCGLCLADDRLTEFDFGSFEGASRADAEYQRLKRQFCSKYENGESVLAVAARVYPFLDEIRVKYRDKTVLLVCHNAMMRVINAYFTAPNNDEFFDFAVGNCETVFYET